MFPPIKSRSLILIIAGLCSTAEHNEAKHKSISPEIDQLLNGEGLFAKLDLGNQRGARRYSHSNNDTQLVEIISNELQNGEVLKEMYDAYKSQFGGEETTTHLTERLDVFKTNVMKIAKHNIMAKRGRHSFEMGITQFMDEPLSQSRTTHPLTANVTLDVPTSLQKPWFKKFRHSFSRHFDSFTGNYIELDWRKSGAVSSAKDQGKCGSCAFFAAVAAIEAHHYLVQISSPPINKTTWPLTTPPNLSEQELLDCTKNYVGYRGCNDNLVTTAFDYVKDNGLSYERDYPYWGKVGEGCHGRWYRDRVPLKNYYKVTPSFDEEVLKKVVRDFGPVVVGMYASDDFKMYKKGVYDLECKDKSGISHNTYINHMALIVGYGRDRDAFGFERKYWIMKNSYGEWWGEDRGYFRILRGQRLCLIGEDAYYLYSDKPVVSSTQGIKW